LVYLDVFVCLGALCYPASRQLECTLVFGDHDRAICCFFRGRVGNFNFLSANLELAACLRMSLSSQLREEGALYRFYFGALQILSRRSLTYPTKFNLP